MTVERGEGLTGRVALVTKAGFRAGIGADICRALAAHGAELVLAYWTPYDREEHGSVGDETAWISGQILHSEGGFLRS